MGFVAALLLAQPAEPSRADAPAACGTMIVAISNVESLRAAGAYEPALASARRILSNDLAEACRLHVRHLEALILGALGREEEARAIYASMLDRMPSWRPSRRSSSVEERRVFEAARAAWVKGNAGPLRVTPVDVSLLSADRRVQSSSQPLLIQALQQGEISWRVRTDEPWLAVSRRHGTTVAGRDTVVVAARTSPGAEPETTRRGRLVFEAPPWPDVEVDVSWHILAPVEPSIAATHARRSRTLLFLGFALATVAGGVAFAAR